MKTRPIQHAQAQHKQHVFDNLNRHFDHGHYDLYDSIERFSNLLRIKSIELKNKCLEKIKNFFDKKDEPSNGSVQAAQKKTDIQIEQEQTRKLQNDPKTHAKIAEGMLVAAKGPTTPGEIEKVATGVKEAIKVQKEIENDPNNGLFKNKAGNSLFDEKKQDAKLSEMELQNLISKPETGKEYNGKVISIERDHVFQLCGKENNMVKHPISGLSGIKSLEVGKNAKISYPAEGIGIIHKAPKELGLNHAEYSRQSPSPSGDAGIGIA